METRFSEVTTTAALIKKKKLRKGFRRFGMICYTFGTGNIKARFVQVLGVAISNALLAYLLMLPSCPILHYTYSALPRRYLVPGGKVGAWIVTLLPMFYCGIACYFLLVPNDAYLQNNHLDRLTFELTHFVLLACIILLTIVLSIWGHKQSQNRDVLVDLTAITLRENYPLLSPMGNGISPSFQL
jgi:glutamate:GABA antiporter